MKIEKTIWEEERDYLDCGVGKDRMVGSGYNLSISYTCIKCHNKACYFVQLISTNLKGEGKRPTVLIAY